MPKTVERTESASQSDGESEFDAFPVPVPVPVPAPDPSAEERRQGPRRSPIADRAVNALLEPMALHHWFPRKWTYLIAGMITALVVCAGFAEQLPGPGTWAILGCSVVLASQISRVHDLVAHRSPAFKGLGTFAVVILPLFQFGLGLTLWTNDGGVSSDIVLVAMLCVSSIATVYSRRQPAVIFAVQFAIWSPTVVTHSSLAGILGLAACLVVAVLVVRELLEENRVERERIDTQERLQTRARDILADYEETGQGWFWETDRRSQLTYVSASVARMLRRNPDRLVGQPFTRLFDLADTSDAGERTLLFHLSARSAFSELPMRAALDKEERWWSISGRPIYDQFDNFVGFRGSGTDLTERKRSQEQATRLARYDALTGLANRFQMSQALEKILGSQAEANRHCAVLLLDLDRFKQVNDTMGHPAGDALLKQVAQRLERAVGRAGQVGRVGGDEFKVVIPARVPRQTLADLGHEIIHSLSQPYSIDGQRVVIGASIGIALAPEHGANSDELIRNADLALYAAKDGGRGRYHFYAEDLHAEAEARSQLEEDLRDAVAKGEMQLHYQPIVSLATDRISGFEALMRWQHPIKGWISPGRFIGIAEDCGLIQELGEWALQQACQDLAHWPEEVCVAVNVSPIQFSNPNLPTVVAKAISQAGVRASRLELEITESVFLGDYKGTDEMFAALKHLGVRLALDDFGTGYSSLGYLRKAPFDKIKIDQSFVRGMTEQGSRNAAIITSITSLAQTLGMDTTAEGVETHNELHLIRQHGCSHVQGYIYDRPLTAEQVIHRINNGLQAVARGPQSTRLARQTMLRKVVLEHNGQFYNGMIRNISTTGAMIEGLWNVPVGTSFHMQISHNQTVSCVARWSADDRMGVEFANPLQRDAAGQITAIQSPTPRQFVPEEFQKTG